MKRKIGKSNWSLPQKAKDYFDPHYDDVFKEKHPVLYWLTVIVIIILVLIPPIACIGFLATINVDVDNFIELFLLLVGFISSFGISIGFCNLFMILHKQYLGHYVTIVSFLIGVFGSGGSLFLLWLMSQ